MSSFRYPVRTLPDRLVLATSLEACLDLDELYRVLRGSHVQAVGVMNTLRDPLLVLDGDLTILSANRAFYRAF
jgi:PAS domain-containing protein